MHRAFLKDICSLRSRKWSFPKSWVWSQISVRHLVDMAWQYCSSIPVGRRDVFYWFKWLPVWYRNGSGLGIFDHSDIGCRTVRQFKNTLKRWKRIRTVLHPARPHYSDGLGYGTYSLHVRWWRWKGTHPPRPYCWRWKGIHLARP